MHATLDPGAVAAVLPPTVGFQLFGVADGRPPSAARSPKSAIRNPQSAIG
jgi:hypothetical protein